MSTPAPESPLSMALRLIDEYRMVGGCDPTCVVTTPALWNAIWEEMGPDRWSYYPRTILTVDYVQIKKNVGLPPGTMYALYDVTP